MFTLKLVMNFKVKALPQVSLHKLENNYYILLRVLKCNTSDEDAAVSSEET